MESYSFPITYLPGFMQSDGISSMHLWRKVMEPVGQTAIYLSSICSEEEEGAELPPQLIAGSKPMSCEHWYLLEICLLKGKGTQTFRKRMSWIQLMGGQVWKPSSVLANIQVSISSQWLSRLVPLPFPGSQLHLVFVIFRTIFSKHQAIWGFFLLLHLQVSCISGKTSKYVEPLALFVGGLVLWLRSSTWRPISFLLKGVINDPVWTLISLSTFSY